MNVHDKLVAKVNNIKTSGFILKTKYYADKTKLENKIPNTNKLIKKSDHNAWISELENKIPSITGLVTTCPLTAVENKFPSVSNLIKKTEYDPKLVNLKRKSLIISITNILLLKNLKLAQVNLIKKQISIPNGQVLPETFF